MHHLRPPRKSGRRALASALAGLALAALIPAATLAGAGAAGAVTACDTAWKTPGTSGSFAVGANWTNGVPTTKKGACLPDSPTAYTVTNLGLLTHALSMTVGTGATLHLESNASGTAALLVGLGGVFNYGTIELVNTDSVPRPTTLRVKSSNFENAGTLSVLPSVGDQVFDGKLHNGTTGTLDAQSNAQVTRLDNDGTVSVAAGVTLTASTLANFVGSTHTLTRGQFDLDGTLAVPNTDVTRLDAGVSLDLYGTIQNSTTNTSAFDGLTSVTPNGELSVSGGVNLRTGPLTNHGRVLIGTDSSIASFGNYTEAGVYTSLASNSQLYALEGTVTITTGSIVGSGAVEAPVVNQGGFVYPAPQLLFGDGYTQKKDGTLSVRVGDVMGDDRLTVDGTATLGGTLTVTAGSNVTPAPGTSYNVVNAGSINRRFAHFTSSGLPAPATFEASYGSQIVAAVIVDSYDDTDWSVTYAGWRGHITPGTGATFRDTCSANETATFAFAGNKVVWNTVHGSEMGDAEVFVDGIDKGTFDLFASTNAPFAQTFGGLGAGAHTIVVKVLGTHNVQAGDSCVVVDSFQVGAAVTEDTSRKIEWTGWSGVTTGTNGYRVATGRSQLSFSGNMDGAEWITRIGPDQGNAEGYVDGELTSSVGLYSPQAHANVRIFVPTTNDYHTITIVALGTQVDQSTGAAVAFDGYVIHGPSATEF